MRRLWNSLITVVVALAGVALLGVSATVTTMVQLIAARTLVMGGTGNPMPNADYVDSMIDNYVRGAHGPAEVVWTPEEFFPTTGTKTFDVSVAEGVTSLRSELDPDDTLVIVGYSQSTRIATITKNQLIKDYEDTPVGDIPDYRFVLVSNVNRPNGGILNRLQFLGGVPFLGITFDGATRTDSPEVADGDYAFDTVDITIRHDGWSDFPVRPLNPFALANAFAGIAYNHPTYPTMTDPDLVYQGTQGDTKYYMIVPKIVPLLQPLADAGVPMPLLVALNEPLLVLIEDAYDRETNPGIPVGAQLSPIGNPITLVVNLVRSIPVGIDAGLEEAGLGRPLNTTPSGPYGVGGPTPPPPPPGDELDTNVALRQQSEPTQLIENKVVEDTQEQKVDVNTKLDDDQDVDGATPDPKLSDDESDVPPNNQKATKPWLLRPKVRGPIQFDAPKPSRATGDRPSLDRPLRKVLSVLTGQRPDRDDDKPAADPGGPAKDNEAA